MAYNYDYFISYAHEDNKSDDDKSGFVDEFVSRLQNSEEHQKMFGRKINVFFDKSEIHSMTQWDSTIRAELAQSRFLIVLLSPGYFKSEYCAKEFDWWMKHEMHRRVLGEGTAPMIIVAINGVYDFNLQTIPEIPVDLQTRFPNWLSQIRQIQIGSDFNLDYLNRGRINDALISLREEVKDRVMRQDAAEKSPYTNQYPKYNANFVGRRDNLLSLRAFLCESAEAAYSALTGLPGFGKTELALTYGHAFAWDYQLGRVFVKCENKTSLSEALLTSGIAEMHGWELPKSSEDQQLTFLFSCLKAKQEAIIKRNEQEGILRTRGAHLLLILDNVNKLELISKKNLANLPDYFHVIITTLKNANDFPHIHSESVERLSEDESVELLSNLFPFETPEEADAARKIAKLLEGFTLAVELTGSYLDQKKRITYQKQYERLNNNLSEAVQTMANKIGELTLHSAASVSVVLDSTLSSLSDDARKALDYAAVMVPDTVALGWIPELLGLDEDDGWDVVDELTGYRLLTPLQNEPNIARLHRLVAGAVIQEIPEETRKEINAKIREKCNDLLEKDERFWCIPKNAWNISPISEFALALAEQWTLEASEEEIDWGVTKMLEKSGKSLTDLGKNDSALSVYKEFLRIAEARASVFSSDDVLRDLALAWSNLGEMDYKAGSLDSAKESHTKAFNIRKSLAEKQPDNVEIQCDLADSYLSLGDIDRDKGNSKEAKERYSEMLNISEKFKATLDKRVLRNLSISYERLGNREKAVGNTSATREWFEKSLEIDKLAVEIMPDNVKALRGLSVSYELLGNLERNIGHIVEARAWYEKALEIDQQLAEQMPESVQAQRNLSFSFTDIGTLERDSGNADVARMWYKKALDIRQQLADKMPENVDAQENLSFSFIDLGILEQAIGNTDAARTWYEKTLDIRQQLADKMPDNVDAQENLSSAYTFFGRLEKAVGNTVAARAWYEKALKIDQRLAEMMSEDVNAQSNLKDSYMDLGDLEDEAGNANAAREWFEKGLEITLWLADKIPEDRYVQADLSCFYVRLGDLEFNAGNIDAARDWYEKKLQTDQRQVDKMPENVYAQRYLAISYWRLGALDMRDRKYDSAQTWYEKALDIHQQLVEKTPHDLGVLRDLSNSYGYIGNIEEAAGNTDAARMWYEKAVETLLPLADTTSDVDIMNNLSASCINIGNMEKAAGNTEAALEWYEKALDITLQLVKTTPNDEVFQSNLSNSLRCICSLIGLLINRGKMEKDAGNFAAARESYEKALAILQRLDNKTPENVVTLLSLSSLYDQFGRLENAAGNTDSALEWFEKALKVDLQLVKTTPDDESFQENLSLSLHRIRSMSDSYINRGNWDRRTGNAADARESYEKALGILQRLANIIPEDAETLADIAKLQEKLA